MGFECTTLWSNESNSTQSERTYLFFFLKLWFELWLSVETEFVWTTWCLCAWKNCLRVCMFMLSFFLSHFSQFVCMKVTKRLNGTSPVPLTRMDRHLPHIRWRWGPVCTFKVLFAFFVCLFLFVLFFYTILCTSSAFLSEVSPCVGPPGGQRRIVRQQGAWLRGQAAQYCGTGATVTTNM